MSHEHVLLCKLAPKPDPRNADDAGPSDKASLASFWVLKLKNPRP